MATAHVHNPADDGAPSFLESLSIEEIWDYLELAKEGARMARERQWRFEHEIMRRVAAARPDFGPESGGGADLVGETAVLTVTFSRDYEYDNARLVELVTGEHITPAEFEELVSYQPKVNGTVFNRLLKRGGPVAEMLTEARALKSSRPLFAVKGRA